MTPLAQILLRQIMHKDRADSYEKSLCLTKENGVVRNK